MQKETKKIDTGYQNMCKHSGKCMHKQGAQALYLSRSMLSRHAWSYFLQQPNILYSNQFGSIGQMFLLSVNH